MLLLYFYIIIISGSGPRFGITLPCMPDFWIFFLRILIFEELKPEKGSQMKLFCTWHALLCYSLCDFSSHRIFSCISSQMTLIYTYKWVISSPFSSFLCTI